MQQWETTKCDTVQTHHDGTLCTAPHIPIWPKNQNQCHMSKGRNEDSGWKIIENILGHQLSSTFFRARTWCRGVDAKPHPLLLSPLHLLCPCSYSNWRKTWSRKFTIKGHKLSAMMPCLKPPNLNLCTCVECTRRHRVSTQLTQCTSCGQDFCLACSTWWNDDSGLECCHSCHMTVTKCRLRMSI